MCDSEEYQRSLAALEAKGEKLSLDQKEYLKRVLDNPLSDREYAADIAILLAMEGK